MPVAWEELSCHIFTSLEPDNRTERSYTTGTQNELCFSFHGFYSHRNTAIETIERFYFLCPCQKKLTFLNEEDTQRGYKKKISMS